MVRHRGPGSFQSLHWNWQRAPALLNALCLLTYWISKTTHWEKDCSFHHILQLRKPPCRGAEYVVCGLTGSTWQDLSQVAWLYLPHFMYSPLNHTQRVWLNSHLLLSVINVQLIANPMVLLMLNHKNSSLCFAIALTPQDKKSGCTRPSSRSQWGTGAWHSVCPFHCRLS